MHSENLSDDEFYRKHLRPFPTERSACRRPWTPEHVAHFSQILRQGTERIHCSAGSLYLLDDKTTSLTLKSHWGLAEERLDRPVVRSLATSIADLEALLGNAVVLNEPFLREKWNSPEDYVTGLCIPVAVDALVIGTIWFFSDEKRDFSTAELNELEIISGRIALDLKRLSLLEEVSRTNDVSPARRRRDVSHHKTVDSFTDFSSSQGSVNEEIPSETEEGYETEVFLDALRRKIEKNGHCKTMTLFVTQENKKA